jgi:hypothetical protein
MLDNLRSQTSFEPEEEEELPAPIEQNKPKRPKKRRSLDKMTGMKAPQRFMLALMLMIMVCLLGVILLVLAGKIVFPVSF